jgi:glyoxylase-like metal-dependent hydrolase (beta-lactamase superfamily II)
MPFAVVPTPGHAPDHLAFRTPGGVLFSGDAVLGEGSVFVWPDPGALAGYLAVLEELLADPPALICPGHGPVVGDAAGKLREYLVHRRAREAALVAALDAGARTTDALLDAAWADVPDPLRLAAAVTLAAHLDKLEEEGRLPPGTERPAVPVLTGP